MERTINETRAYLNTRQGISEIISLCSYGDLTLSIKEKYDRLVQSGSVYREDRIADVIINGGEIIVRDDEDDIVAVIDKDKWASGIDKMIESGDCLTDWLNDSPDFISAYIALQYIAFGEVVYC